MTRPSRSMFPHLVDVQALAEKRNATGGVSMLPTTLATAVPCLIDRRSGGRGAIGAGDLEKKGFEIFFPDPIELREGYQLVDSNNPTRVFQVNSFDNELNLDRLWVARCDQQVSPAAPSGGTP